MDTLEEEVERALSGLSLRPRPPQQPGLLNSAILPNAMSGSERNCANSFR